MCPISNGWIECLSQIGLLLCLPAVCAPKVEPGDRQVSPVRQVSLVAQPHAAAGVVAPAQQVLVLLRAGAVASTAGTTGGSSWQITSLQNYQRHNSSINLSYYHCLPLRSSMCVSVPSCPSTRPDVPTSPPWLRSEECPGKSTESTKCQLFSNPSAIDYSSACSFCYLLVPSSSVLYRYVHAYKSTALCVQAIGLGLTPYLNTISLLLIQFAIIPFIIILLLLSYHYIIL